MLCVLVAKPKHIFFLHISGARIHKTLNNNIIFVLCYRTLIIHNFYIEREY